MSLTPFGDADVCDVCGDGAVLECKPSPDSAGGYVWTVEDDCLGQGRGACS